MNDCRVSKVILCICLHMSADRVLWLPGIRRSIHAPGVYMHARDAPGYACAGSACREYACAGAPGMCAGVCARVYAPGYACAAGEICAGVCMRRAPGPCGICMRRGMHAPGYVRRSRCMQAMAGAGMHAPGDALPPGIIYAPDATSRQNAIARREPSCAGRCMRPGYNMRGVCMRREFRYVRSEPVTNQKQEFWTKPYLRQLRFVNSMVNCLLVPLHYLQLCAYAIA
jgi:hypothetical protein